MPAAAPVARPADRTRADVDADEVPPAAWVADQLPPSARVADRMLGTCRAAGCAPLTDRRPPRRAPLRQAAAPRRRSSW